FFAKMLPHHSMPYQALTLQIWDTAGQERFSSLSSTFSVARIPKSLASMSIGLRGYQCTPSTSNGQSFVCEYRTAMRECKKCLVVAGKADPVSAQRTLPSQKRLL
ncbi:hypothetical protein BGY98DRAFT_915584, partial [Russula aff. rugulosa BPL654]